MASENPIAFGRCGFLIMFLRAVEGRYGISTEDLNIPTSLLEDPMRPMPLSEMTRYFGVLQERINDPLLVARACSSIELQYFPPLQAITQSTPVLFSAVMKMSSLGRVIQTGCKFITKIEHDEVRWSYDARILVVAERLLDGMMAAWVFIHLLRHYLGNGYSPTKLLLPGSQIGESKEVARIFGCEIVWNSQQTEVHFPADTLQSCSPIGRSIVHSSRNKRFSPLSYTDLPEETDFVRCVYEIINYVRAFGYPKQELVANILNMPPITLQRRLQKEKQSYSGLVKYQLLFNLAPEMLLAGKSENQVSAELGFKNRQSFDRAFKKAHGQTPTQYLGNLEEYL
ncbi:AraC family transcriptional regulator [Agarivorans aestuarii]|uniref:AraC family transcriptional regulator n=1 Tax=Agarivorans aestuarii TaxID=1563703 RepID=UPI001C80F44A|nr:AraC family transcriptional regulator [Agarivorans aestuarii]